MSEVFADYRWKLDDGTFVYKAGINRYTRNFSRDVLVAGLLSSDKDLLKTQLNYAARMQGQQDTPRSGEKPGRIHHEIPGVPYRLGGNMTTFNACDTTGLFLIGLEGLSYAAPELTTAFLATRLESVQMAIGHIAAQTNGNHLFMESPPAPAESFALRVTYWKDSVLPNPEGKEEPVYPIFIPQPHFIAARGILSASKILKDDTLKITAQEMFEAGIKIAMTDENYLAYHDNEEPKYQASSDELHSLAYIPEEYADLLPLPAICERAEEYLKTPYGYVCTPKYIADYLSDTYHGYNVWAFEQAVINYGANKFGLKEATEVSRKIVPMIGSGQELFAIDRSHKTALAIPQGDERQLWSVAANEYFAGRSLLAESAWL